MKVRLGKEFLIDLVNKMQIVRDEPDLFEDYHLTAGEVDAFLDTLPSSPKGSVEIEIPDRLTDCVIEEMENQVQICLDEADSEGIKAIGTATAYSRQIERIRQARTKEDLS